MSRKMFFLSVAVTVCLSVASVLAFRSRSRQDQALVRLTYAETTRLRDGKIEAKGKRVRVVEVATGQYKETTYSPDGQEQDSMLVSRKGVFVIMQKMIQPTDEFMPPPPESFSAESVKNNSTGTAQILGYTAYIKKSARGSVEIWSAPELGSHVPLKVIMYGADRISYTQLEAVEIAWQTAAPAGFFDPPADLPVDVSKLERALEGAETRNDQRGVLRYKRLLAKWKR
jgi:hypothetical protein